MEFKIRSVTSEDFSQWAALWQGYNEFYGRPDFAIEITRLTWSRFFDASESVHALIADRNGVLLGLAHYIFHRSTTMAGPTCYLQDLFTATAARGHGVGRALIEEVYERARVGGATRVYWQTHESNLRAIALYDQVAERSGFVVYRKEFT
jgi:GNAT superfamily N-acetyltransferase